MLQALQELNVVAVLAYLCMLLTCRSGLQHLCPQSLWFCLSREQSPVMTAHTTIVSNLAQHLLHFCGFGTRFNRP